MSECTPEPMVFIVGRCTCLVSVLQSVVGPLDHVSMMSTEHVLVIAVEHTHLASHYYHLHSPGTPGHPYQNDHTCHTWMSMYIWSSVLVSMSTYYDVLSYIHQCSSQHPYYSEDMTGMHVLM